MSFIKARNLVHEFTEYDEKEAEEVFRAIDGIDLDIEKGQFVAILGHNGSGKSTFAKHLNALLKPTEGTVWVNGLDTREEENIWKIRQSAGMVFQNPDNQIIANVVEEDVGFGPENMGVPTKEIWERVDEALHAVGMEAYRTHSPNRLSGGQKQRVAIAGIVAMRPECIVLDEPTAMLDPNGREEVLKVLLELNHREKVTIILITHHMTEVLQADRVYVMDQGKIVMAGTPREVFSQVEELKAISLEVPQVTEVLFELSRLGFSVPKGVTSIEEFTRVIQELAGHEGINGPKEKKEQTASGITSDFSGEKLQLKSSEGRGLS